VTICFVFPHVYNCQVIENKLPGDTIRAHKEERLAIF